MLAKDQRWECKAYRDAAAKGSCVNCGTTDGTVVFAHGNESLFGKGKGLKAHDVFGADLCHHCHGYVDNQQKQERTGVWGDNREDRLEFMRRMIFLTLLRRARAGWIRKPSV